MGTLFSNLGKSKTFWTGMAAILGAGYSYSSGEMGSQQAIQLGVTGALGVFLRMAIAKLEAK